MQKLFKEVASLDQRCYNKFDLNEDILMEHAANGIANFIRQNYDTSHSIVIVCGSGNNGADGIALARLLHTEYCVSVYLPLTGKSLLSGQYLKVKLKV